MKKLFDWCLCRHPKLQRFLPVSYAVALVLVIFGGGYALGSLVTWSQAGNVIAHQRADYQESLKLLSGRVETGATATRDAADAVEKAAQAVVQAASQAGGAAATADSAGRTARGAAITAKSAAMTAKSASEELTEALMPPAPASTDWLGGP